MDYTKKMAELTAEKVDLENKLAGEQNSNICVALRHNLSVCNKEIELTLKEKNLFEKNEDLKKQAIESTDAEQRTFYNAQVVALQSQANEIFNERKRLGDALERYDLDTIYELMNGRTM